MTNFAPRQILLAFMAIATGRNLMLSVNLSKKYPYWTDYLKDPRSCPLDLIATSNSCHAVSEFNE